MLTHEYVFLAAFVKDLRKDKCISTLPSFTKLNVIT